MSVGNIVKVTPAAAQWVLQLARQASTRSGETADKTGKENEANRPVDTAGHDYATRPGDPAKAADFGTQPFSPQGEKAVLEVLRKYGYARMADADSNPYADEHKLLRNIEKALEHLPKWRRRELAAEMLRSGLDHRVTACDEGTQLYKVVREGTVPSGGSPYFMTREQLGDVWRVRESLAQLLSLPRASRSTHYEIYEVTAKEPTVVLSSMVAPAQEAGESVIGGAGQSLITNRSHFTDPVKVDPASLGL